MRTGEEYLMTFPAYVVKQSTTQAMGFAQLNIIGLALFTDEAAASEWLQPGQHLQLFADNSELLAYLRGLTGDFNHVAVDPKLGKQTGFAKLADFISWIEGAGPIDPTEAERKGYDPFSHLSLAERSALRERIREMVQIQGMSVRQASVTLQLEERHARWLLRNGAQ
jgi:hypothetical protein